MFTCGIRKCLHQYICLQLLFLSFSGRRRRASCNWPRSADVRRSARKLSRGRNFTGVNFINILLTNFSYERRFVSFFTYIEKGFRKKLQKRRHTYEKFVLKMLMKLTLGWFDSLTYHKLLSCKSGHFLVQQSVAKYILTLFVNEYSDLI